MTISSQAVQFSNENPYKGVIVWTNSVKTKRIPCIVLMFGSFLELRLLMELRKFL